MFQFIFHFFKIRFVLFRFYFDFDFRFGFGFAFPCKFQRIPFRFYFTGSGFFPLRSPSASWIHFPLVSRDRHQKDLIM